MALDGSADRVLLGGVDGVAGIYSLSQRKLLQAFKGGAAITSGIWAGSNSIISTSGGAVKVFQGDTEAASFSTHVGPVSGLALHPSGDILASAGVDKSYVLYDLTNMSTVMQIFSDSGMAPHFHRLGSILTIL